MFLFNKNFTFFYTSQSIKIIIYIYFVSTYHLYKIVLVTHGSIYIPKFTSIWIGHISKILNLPFFEYQKKSKKNFYLFLDTSSDPKYPILHSSSSKKITVFTPLRHMGYHRIIRCPGCIIFRR